MVPVEKRRDALDCCLLSITIPTGLLGEVRIVQRLELLPGNGENKGPAPINKDSFKK